MKTISKYTNFASNFIKYIAQVAISPITIILVAIITVWLIFQLENDNSPVLFAISIFMVLVAVLVWASRRPAFSFYCALLVFGTLTAISLLKFKLKGFSLHYYDLVFVANDPKIVEFLAGSFAYIILPLLLLVGLAVAAVIVLFSSDRKWQIGRTSLTACVALPVLMLPATFPEEASADRYSYYLQGRHVSAFYVSLLDLEYLFFSENLEKTLADMPPETVFPADSLCPADTPDVFVVLGESQVDPSIFPQIDKGNELAKRFAKDSGPLQPLTVEVFGGGTWISNLSLMTGLPSRAFGWRSPYLTIELEGKVRGSLPEMFSQCGYRTVALLPMEFKFVNEGPFLESIGFETVFDKKAINAPYYHMRDKFYYEAAERIITDHRKNDGRPLFFTMQTMFPHSPYNERLEPAIQVAGEPLHSDPEVAEYLRRVVIARQDLDKFVDGQRDLKSESGLVLLDYGDHQSFATKGFVEQMGGQDVMSRPGSIAYRTFYTMRHFTKDGALTYHEDNPVDIALLGSRLLKFAPLPSNPVWDDMARLDRECGGAMHACSTTGELERHLRRRVDSGLLDILEPESGSGQSIAHGDGAPISEEFAAWTIEGRLGTRKPGSLGKAEAPGFRDLAWSAGRRGVSAVSDARRGPLR